MWHQNEENWAHFITHALYYAWVKIISLSSQQNEKTSTSYSKMFNANDSGSINGTCNTYVRYPAQKT